MACLLPQGQQWVDSISSPFIIHITVFHQLWWKSFLNLLSYVPSKVNALYFSILVSSSVGYFLDLHMLFFMIIVVNTIITGPQDCSRIREGMAPQHSLLTVWFTQPFDTHQLCALLSLCHPKTVHFSQSPLNIVSSPHHLEIFTIPRFFAVKNFKQILT